MVVGDRRRVRLGWAAGHGGYAVFGMPCVWVNALDHPSLPMALLAWKERKLRTNLRGARGTGASRAARVWKSTNEPGTTRRLSSVHTWAVPSPPCRCCCSWCALSVTCYTRFPSSCPHPISLSAPGDLPAHTPSQLCNIDVSPVCLMSKATTWINI